MSARKAAVERQDDLTRLLLLTFNITAVSLIDQSLLEPLNFEPDIIPHCQLITLTTHKQK